VRVPKQIFAKLKDRSRS